MSSEPISAPHLVTPDESPARAAEGRETPGESAPRPVLNLALGLDRSQDRLGWAVVEFETGTPVACGMLPVKPDGGEEVDLWHPDRPALTCTALAEVESSIARHLGHEMFDVVLIGIETPYVGRSGKVAVGFAVAAGMTWQAAWRRWPNAAIGWHAPDSWKARVGVEPTPRDPDRPRAALKNERGNPKLRLAGLARAQALGLNVAECEAVYRSEKPYVYIRALQLGFEPGGSQDAADAACIAVAARLVDAELMARIA